MPTLKNLSAADLRQVIETPADELSTVHLQALLAFIEEIGGVENAELALEILEDLEQAA